MSSAVNGPADRVHTSRLVLRCWPCPVTPLWRIAFAPRLEHRRPWLPSAQHQPEDLQATTARLRCCRGQFDLGRDFVYDIFSRNETRVLGGSGLHMRLGEG